MDLSKHATIYILLFAVALLLSGCSQKDQEVTCREGTYNSLSSCEGKCPGKECVKDQMQSNCWACKTDGGCALGEPAEQCFKTCGFRNGECKEVSAGCSICSTCKEGEPSVKCAFDCPIIGGQCRQVSANPDCSVCEKCTNGEPTANCLATCGAKKGYCDQVSKSPDCSICATCTVGEPPLDCAATCPAKGGTCVKAFSENCYICDTSAAANETKKCDVEGFLNCWDRTADPDCMLRCPFSVLVECAPGSPKESVCHDQDPACLDACQIKNNAAAKKCAEENNCSDEEIQKIMAEEPE